MTKRVQKRFTLIILSFFHWRSFLTRKAKHLQIRSKGLFSKGLSTNKPLLAAGSFVSWGGEIIWIFVCTATQNNKVERAREEERDMTGQPSFPVQVCRTSKVPPFWPPKFKKDSMTIFLGGCLRNQHFLQKANFIESFCPRSILHKHQRQQQNYFRCWRLDLASTKFIRT